MRFIQIHYQERKIVECKSCQESWIFNNWICHVMIFNNSRTQLVCVLTTLTFNDSSFFTIWCRLHRKVEWRYWKFSLLVFIWCFVFGNTYYVVFYIMIKVLVLLKVIWNRVKLPSHEISNRRFPSCPKNLCFQSRLSGKPLT